MSDPVGHGARRAAERLAVELDPRLVADVEAELASQHAPRAPEQYLDPVSLGAFVVSMASLAWTIYRDLKKRSPALAREIVARKIRVEAAVPGDLAPAQRDRIIEVVVEETIKAATREN